MEWCDRFNLYVKRHAKFPNLSPPSMVFKIKEPKRGAGSDIHMISLIGDELLTLSKFICEEPILSTLEEGDQQLVIQTLKLISLFYRQLTDDELKEGGYLFQQIILFRRLFAASFLGKKPHPNHRLKGTTRKNDVEVNLADEWCFNLKIPTLSSLLSVPEIIRFLGPCRFLDTSLFESLHFEWRLAQNSVNGLNNVRDIIRNVFGRFQAQKSRCDGEFKEISEQVASLHHKNRNQALPQKPQVHEFGNKTS